MLRRLCVPALSLFCAVGSLACEADAPAGGAADVVRPAAPLATMRPTPAAAVVVEDAGTAEPTLLERERLSVERGDVTDHRRLGEEMLAQHRLDEAITALRTALVVDASADVWSRLGAAYVQDGQLDRGLRCLQEAVTVDVDHLASRQILARTLLTRNDGAGARQQAEEWVRLEPTSAAARQALGRSLTQLGMWREAIDQYRLVVELQPDNACAHNNLGYAAPQRGDTPLAAAHLERVLSLTPQQGYMLNNLGVAWERQGRAGEAHAAFARAAELSPKYAQAALNRDRLQRGLDLDNRSLSAVLLDRFRHDDGASASFDTASLQGLQPVVLPTSAE